MADFTKADTVKASDFVPFDQQARNRVTEAFHAARADYAEKLDAVMAATTKLAHVTLALDVIERAIGLPLPEKADAETARVASIVTRTK